MDWNVQNIDMSSVYQWSPMPSSILLLISNCTLCLVNYVFLFLKLLILPFYFQLTLVGASVPVGGNKTSYSSSSSLK